MGQTSRVRLHARLGRAGKGGQVVTAGTWWCGWDGCPDKDIRRPAAHPAEALDHHYSTHHQHQAKRMTGSTHGQAWAAIDARAIASGRRRSNPGDYAAARATA